MKFNIGDIISCRVHYANKDGFFIVHNKKIENVEYSIDGFQYVIEMGGKYRVMHEDVIFEVPDINAMAEI